MARFVKITLAIERGVETSVWINPSAVVWVRDDFRFGSRGALIAMVNGSEFVAREKPAVAVLAQLNEVEE